MPLDDQGNPRSVFSLGEPLRIRARYEALQAVDRPLFRIAITSPTHGVTVCIADTQTADIPIEWTSQARSNVALTRCRFVRPVFDTALHTGSELAGLYDALTLGESFVVHSGEHQWRARVRGRPERSGSHPIRNQAPRGSGDDSIRLTGMAQPILFVAREPDEKLRTYLPVIDEVQRRGAQARVYFTTGH